MLEPGVLTLFNSFIFAFPRIGVGPPRGDRAEERKQWMGLTDLLNVTCAEPNDAVYAHPPPQLPLMPPARLWYEDLPRVSLPPRLIDNHNTQICEVIRDLVRTF